MIQPDLSKKINTLDKNKLGFRPAHGATPAHRASFKTEASALRRLNKGPEKKGL
jgi:hypothetical protein